MAHTEKQLPSRAMVPILTGITALGSISVDVFYFHRVTASEPKTTDGLGVTVHLFIGSLQGRKKRT